MLRSVLGRTKPMALSTTSARTSGSLREDINPVDSTLDGHLRPFLEASSQGSHPHLDIWGPSWRHQAKGLIPTWTSGALPGGIKPRVSSPPGHLGPFLETSAPWSPPLLDIWGPSWRHQPRGLIPAWTSGSLRGDTNPMVSSLAGHLGPFLETPAPWSHPLLDIWVPSLRHQPCGLLPSWRHEPCDLTPCWTSGSLRGHMNPVVYSLAGHLGPFLGTLTPWSYPFLETPALWSQSLLDIWGPSRKHQAKGLIPAWTLRSLPGDINPVVSPVSGRLGLFPETPITQP